MGKAQEALAVFTGGSNVATEDESTNRPLTGANGREPVRKPKAGEPGSIGDTAFKDACIVVGVAWLVLFFLAFSLRGHNV